MMQLFASLESSAFSVWVRESNSVWGYPTVLTFHTFGMMVLVGASWAVDLRLLGIGRRIPLGPMQTLFRVMWAGFWLNLVTGSILFAADATTRGTSKLFAAKLAFIAVGVLTMVRIRRDLYGTNPAPVAISGTARRLAVASIVMWIAAVTSGRLLAYIK
jgi:hypothetical protein